MGQEKQYFDWGEKVVYYSKDLLLGNPIVTYYDKNSEIVNCQKKDRIDEVFLRKLRVYNGQGLGI